MSPVVETKSISFSWKEPHLELLTNYLERKLNWSIQKIEHKIIPVLKEMHSRRVNYRQTTIDSFFDNHHTKTHKSKRVLKATMGDDKNTASSPVKLTLKSSRKRRKKAITEFL